MPDTCTQIGDKSINWYPVSKNKNDTSFLCNFFLIRGVCTHLFIHLSLFSHLQSQGSKRSGYSYTLTLNYM